MTPRGIIARLTTRGLIGDARCMARQHGVALEDMLGRRKFRQVVRARHRFWLLLSELYNLSYADMGRTFGVDHVAILRGCEAAIRRREGTAVDLRGRGGRCWQPTDKGWQHELRRTD